jgi:hypothetical protein
LSTESPYVNYFNQELKLLIFLKSAEKAQEIVKEDVEFELTTTIGWWNMPTQDGETKTHVRELSCLVNPKLKKERKLLL